MREPPPGIPDPEAELHAILDTVSHAMIAIDQTGWIERFNRGAERMFGAVPCGRGRARPQREPADAAAVWRPA